MNRLAKPLAGGYVIRAHNEKAGLIPDTKLLLDTRLLPDTKLLSDTETGKNSA
jgi:hypothetical protein